MKTKVCKCCGFPGENHEHCYGPLEDSYGRVFESLDHKRWVAVLEKSDLLKGGEVSHRRMVRGYDGIRRPGWAVYFPDTKVVLHKSIDACGYDNGGKP